MRDIPLPIFPTRYQALSSPNPIGSIAPRAPLQSGAPSTAGAAAGCSPAGGSMALCSPAGGAMA